MGFAKEGGPPVLKERRRSSPVPRSWRASGIAAGVACALEKRLATVTLVRLAWAATGRSLGSSSSSKTAAGGKALLKGNVPEVAVMGLVDLAGL